MVNAIKHANANDPDKMVHICITIADKRLIIKVYDNGQGFDINTVPPPDVEGLMERGRGIFLIKTLMDSVVYRKVSGGNVLEMSKKLARHS